MATSTVRTNLAGVLLASANSEFLEYTLKIQGARANFAWVDDADTAILSHLDFGMADQIVWQLKTDPAPNGESVLTVPQRAGYQRTLNLGTDTTYGLSLGFVTAVGYSITVKRCDNTGALQTITDIDYKMDQPTDIVDQDLQVGVK